LSSLIQNPLGGLDALSISPFLVIDDNQLGFSTIDKNIEFFAPIYG
jgi:hypothetical protein